MRLARLAPVNARFAGDQLIQHQAECEDVAAGVGFAPLDLLRRHILQRAEDGAFAGERGLRCRLRTRFSPSRSREPSRRCFPREYCSGLEVAVRDLLAMRRIDRVEDLAGEPSGLLSIGAGPWSGLPSTYSMTR